jgi:hypothetical protein
MAQWSSFLQVAIELDKFSVCMLFPPPGVFDYLQWKRPIADRVLNDARLVQ